METTNKKLFLQMVGVFLWFCSTAAQATPEQTTYVFGVAPQQSPSDSARLWNPLFAYLEQQTALIALEQNPRGRGLLATLNFKGIVSASDAKYADIRALSAVVKEITEP